MVFIMVPAVMVVMAAMVIIVDIDRDDSRRAPVVMAVVGLIRGKGHPADIGFRIYP